jgi:glycogen operon protein
MLLGGDEIGRTQQGNNNAYCQDNELSWYDWEDADEVLLSFTRGMIEFRKEHRVFRRRTFFQGRPIHGSEVGDIAWFTPSGDEMEEHDWAEGFAKSLGVFLNGEALETGRRGEEYADDSFLLLFNADHEPVAFTLPGVAWGDTWEPVTDTAAVGAEAGSSVAKAGDTMEVEARSMVVLRRAPTN